MANQKQSSILLMDHPSRKPPLIRVRTMRRDGYILEKSEVSGFRKYSLQNSCNNLLCFAKYGDQDSASCLLDLVTNEVVKLPNSTHSEQQSSGTSFYGLGFDSRSKVYKTVRILVIIQDDGLHNFVSRVEVNTLGEDDWKPAKGLRFPSGSILGKPISIKGALVWADFPQTNAAYSSQRCANVFKLDEEEFSKVRLPSGLRVGHLVGLNGHLCAVDLSSDSSIHIWVMRDLNGLWESLYTIKMRATRGEKDHRRTRVIGGLENGELLLESYGAYFLYDPATEGLEYLQLPVETDAEIQVHCYTGEADSVDELGSEMDMDGWEWIEHEDYQN